MNIFNKIKILIVLSSFLLCGHAPWGQHEVYRQMHMLVMCSKTDNGAFEFTKNLIMVLDEYLPEAKARAARARDPERLSNLLVTNQIPLAIVSNDLLLEFNKEDSNSYSELLEHSKTLYTFKKMMLIVNHNFPKNYMGVIIDSLEEASKNNHDIVKFIRKNNLAINYDDIVYKKINF